MSSIAAIDIGSNSVRLLIVGEVGAQLCREINITRLAEGVDRSGRLAEAAMQRTLASSSARKRASRSARDTSCRCLA